MDWFKSSRGKKTEDYEKGYLTRYKKGQKVKPKKTPKDKTGQRVVYKNGWIRECCLTVA